MPEQIYARNLKSGDVLFQEGEKGDDAYIVETGAVEISLDLPSARKFSRPSGREKLLAKCR
jgi:CRP-like cAMP-binding protein